MKRGALSVAVQRYHAQRAARGSAACDAIEEEGKGDGEGEEVSAGSAMAGRKL